MINKKYINKNIISNKIIEFNSKKPIWYIIFDDFIEKSLFNECLSEMSKTDIKILSINKWQNSLKETVFIEWDKLNKIDNFFLSKKFEDFLSLFFGLKLEREFYIWEKDIKQKIWNKKGLIAQCYKKWDYYDWHIDWLDKGISLGTFIYYFSAYGSTVDNYWGKLELWKRKWWNIETYEKIRPTSNSLVLLLYWKEAFHRVTKVKSNNLNRISIQATLKVKK
jgi:hypothetical protein